MDKKMETAAEYFKRAIDLTFDYDHRDEATALLEKAIEIHPNFAEAHEILGYMYQKYRPDRSRDAIQLFLKAKEIAKQANYEYIDWDIYRQIMGIPLTDDEKSKLQGELKIAFKKLSQEFGFEIK